MWSLVPPVHALSCVLRSLALDELGRGEEVRVELESALAAGRHARLTHRELGILHYLRASMPNVEIAAELRLREHREDPYRRDLPQARGLGPSAGGAARGRARPVRSTDPEAQATPVRVQAAGSPRSRRLILRR